MAILTEAMYQLQHQYTLISCKLNIWPVLRNIFKFQLVFAHTFSVQSLCAILPDDAKVALITLNMSI